MYRGRFEEEAENCRRQARSYLGRPEASFLLRVAEAFEELHFEQRPRDLPSRRLRRSQSD